MALGTLFLGEPSTSPTTLHSFTTGEHEYFRPSDDQVWGLPGNTSRTIFRSPCPALNALANHGHLPRDGNALTLEILGVAIMKVYNIDKKVLDLIFLALPTTFTLADFEFINHDASLVHVDSFFGEAPFKVNDSLVDELLARAEGPNGAITTEGLAQFRRRRELQASRENPEYSMSSLANFVANGEAAFLVLGLGDADTATISVEHARSFLVDERIPDDYHRSKSPVSVGHMLFVIAKLELLAWLMD